MSRIKISHDLKRLEEDEKDQILVMRDKSVLDDSGDDEVEMENVELAEREKLDVDARRSKHGKKYNPYEEYDSMLSKYDDFDELEKARKEAQTITVEVGKEFQASNKSISHSEVGRDEDTEKSVSVTIGATGSRAVTSSRPMEPLKFQSDFLSKNESAAFAKRAEKKRKKRTREEEEEPMEKFIPTFHQSAEEDEELYAQLSRLRRIETDKPMTNHEEELVASIQTTRESSSGVADFLNRVVPIHEEVEEPSAMEEPMAVEEPPKSDPKIPDLETSPKEPSTSANVSISSDIKVDGGLACALKFFSSRGDLAEKKTDTSSDSKEAYRKLSSDFNKRRQHYKHYKQAR